MHGHVHQHGVALADAAFVAEHGGKDLDVVEELAVGDGLFGFCDGAVVVDGDLVAVALGYVTVDAVVAGVELAVWEPRPVRMGYGAVGKGFGVFFEDCSGWFVPVQKGGLVSPKGLW